MKKEHIRDPMPEKPAGAAAKRRWVRLTAAAACLVLVAAGILLLLPLHSGIRLVSRYPSASDGAYRVPNAGETLFESAVREARTHYSGKRAAFLLAFTVYEDGEPLSGEQKAEEYQRLLAEGYTLSSAECWTYQGKGEKRYFTVVAGTFTEAELSLFKADPRYGYFFYFAKTATAPASPCPGKIASPRSRRTAPERRLRLPYANRILPAKIDHLPTNPRQNRTLPL